MKMKMRKKKQTASTMMRVFMDLHRLTIKKFLLRMLTQKKKAFHGINIKFQKESLISVMNLGIV